MKNISGSANNVDFSRGQHDRQAIIIIILLIQLLDTLNCSYLMLKVISPIIVPVF